MPTKDRSWFERKVRELGNVVDAIETEPAPSTYPEKQSEGLRVPTEADQRCLGMFTPRAPYSVESDARQGTGRYRDVLFLKKEGFNDLLDAARIAQRFDLAIMSTKGYSSTTARTLMERLPGVRFLVLHDFDKDGLGIVHTLRHDTARYQFRRRPEVIDLGLRLADVEAEGLEVEPVSYTRSVRRALQRYGATTQESAFLQARRVELNAFPSDHFVEWLERKLRTHHVTKLIPDAPTLVEAYRRAVQLHHVNAGLTDLARAAQDVSTQARVPKHLTRQVTALVRADPAVAWDDAVAQVAANADAPGVRGSRPRVSRGTHRSATRRGRATRVAAKG